MDCWWSLDRTLSLLCTYLWHSHCEISIKLQLSSCVSMYTIQCALPYTFRGLCRGCSTNTSVIHLLTDKVSHLFPPNHYAPFWSLLQPLSQHLPRGAQKDEEATHKSSKPLELGTCNFYTMFTTCHLSCVMCHVSHVIWHMSPVIFFWLIVSASLWNVCYQRGIPRLVLIWYAGFFLHRTFFKSKALKCWAEILNK